MKTASAVPIQRRSLKLPRLSLITATVVSALLVSVTSALLFASPAMGYATEGCYWPRVNLGESIPWINYAAGADHTAFNQAQSNWNNTPTLVRISTYGAYIVANDSNFGNTGWAGVTNYACTSGGVFQAPVDSFVNDYYSYSGTALEGAATHEIGHALGLAHSTCGALMYFAVGPCQPPTPQQDDIMGINAIY